MYRMITNQDDYQKKKLLLNMFSIAYKYLNKKIIYF